MSSSGTAHRERRSRRPTFISVALLLAAVLMATSNEAAVERTYLASGAVRVASPEVDQTRPAAQVIDLDSLAADASTFDPRVQAFRLGDSRLQVLAEGPDALQSVGDALERLAAEVVREQVNADVPANEQLTPRLFIRISGRSPGSSDEPEAADGNSSVVGTLVVEEPPGTRNPIVNVRVGARLLQVIASSDGGRATLQDQLGPRAEHTVRIAQQRGADGVMTLTVTGSHPQDALANFDTIVRFLEAELRDRQSAASVPVRGQFIIEPVDQPLQAVSLSPGLARSTLLILVVGVSLAGLVLAVMRRSQRRDGTLADPQPGVTGSVRGVEDDASTAEQPSVSASVPIDADGARR